LPGATDRRGAGQPTDQEIAVPHSSKASLLGLTVLLVAGCGSSSGSTAADSKQLVGAGSTLVAPLISQWEPEYDKQAGVAVAYSAIGSGGGISQITARTVDFGASDAPLSEDQVQEAKGVVQIPWALAATDVAYNVPGVGNGLKLSGGVLAEIFLGRIVNWDDPKIAALNPTVALPSLKITAVHRADASGDTYAFTDYLSRVSPTWKSTVGASTEVAFPTGIGGKGNSGVGGAIASTPGAIGYIAISYVLANKLDSALIENAAGRFPQADVQSIAAAAKTLTRVPADNDISIVDPPASAPAAYPISTFTYVIVPRQSPKAAALKAFIRWAITTGQKFGPKLDFAPLPAQILAADEATLAQIEG
jgi:phosphate transport system substrate-binding protein